MHLHAQPRREVAEQAEAVARFDDEQPRPVNNKQILKFNYIKSKL